jgi:hypothetical protein
MDRQNQVTIGVRVPPTTRNALAVLARMTGMTLSELCRWLLVRAMDQDAEATMAVAGEYAVAKYGPTQATVLYDREMERLRLLQSKAAVETPDGTDIIFVTPEVPMAVAEEATYEAVERR